MFMTSPKSSGSTGEVALKIYGERNTGTNYLTLLAERNLCARILPGRVVDSDLRTVFAGDDGEFVVVDGVSFSVEARRTLAIVGESGCGKSVTSLSIMRL